MSFSSDFWSSAESGFFDTSREPRFPPAARLRPAIFVSLLDLRLRSFLCDFEKRRGIVVEPHRFCRRLRFGRNTVNVHTAFE